MKNKQKSVLILGGRQYESYYAPYEKFGPPEFNESKLLHTPSEIGLVVFCGGTDVTPAMYEAKPYTGKESFCQGFDTQRDMEEHLAYKAAKTMGIPMSGICRGAQFLWVMLGGKLIQHVNGHTSTNHLTETLDGEIFTTTSDHHQLPWDYTCPDNVTVTAWSEHKLSSIYRHGPEEIDLPDPPHLIEIEAFETDNIAAFQFHPEWASPNSREFQWAQEQIAKILKYEL